MLGYLTPASVKHVLYLLLRNPEKWTSGLNTGATGNEWDHQWLIPALDLLSYRLGSDNSDTYRYTLWASFRITLCPQLHLSNFRKFRAAKIHPYAVGLNLHFVIQNDGFAPKVAPQHPHQSQRLTEALELDTFTALTSSLLTTLSSITLKWNLAKSITSSIPKASNTVMNAW